MLLYHYTSIENLKSILQCGEIKLTASNLLKPVNPEIINGRLTDETDKYMPVVWFTDLLDFDRANACGLYGSAADKTEAAIVINADKDFYKWDVWAEKNNIDAAWFNALKKAAPLWETFYITEHPAKITETARIILRPDIADLMQ